jgi:hypothetical protein
MKISRWFPLLRRIALPGLATIALSLTTGCIDDEGENPTPTPTPTPSPTPFPTPTPTPTPSSASTASESSVASANAEVMESAADDAVSELTTVQSTLSVNPVDATAVARAQDALARARDAFAVAGLSLAYDDPADPVRLPDGLQWNFESPDVEKFDRLGDLLALLAEEGDQRADVALSSAIELKDDLAALAAAWEEFAGGNFRNVTFLADREAARRIYQGVLATSDVLVAQSASDPESPDIAARLWAIRDVLDGARLDFNGRLVDGDGLLDLIARADAAQAARLDALVNELLATADGVPPGALGRDAMKKLHAELIAAAEALGYRVETQPAER